MIQPCWAIGILYINKWLKLRFRKQLHEAVLGSESVSGELLSSGKVSPPSVAISLWKKSPGCTRVCSNQPGGEVHLGFHCLLLLVPPVSVLASWNQCSEPAAKGFLSYQRWCCPVSLMVRASLTQPDTKHFGLCCVSVPRALS